MERNMENEMETGVIERFKELDLSYSNKGISGVGT